MKQVRLIIFVLIVISFVFLIKAGFDSGFLSVKKIDCKTQYGPCLQDEVKTLEQLLNKNLFLLPTGNVKRQLLQDPKTASVFIQKIFPDRLEVVLERKKAYVGVRKSSLTKDIFLISKDGVVVAQVRDTPLPILEVDAAFSNPVVGEKILDNATKAAMILYFAYKGSEAKMGFLEKDTLRVLFSDGLTVYFPVDGDPEILAGALQLTLSRSKMQKTLPKEIDLRYSNAVLRY